MPAKRGVCLDREKDQLEEKSLAGKRTWRGGVFHRKTQTGGADPIRP